MIRNRNKEKAYNAITYFTENTAYCYKKKLYKLLYILDFEHFQQTGRSVTGYDYFAWKMGPVPTELHEQIEANEDDFAENFDVQKKSLGRDKSGEEIQATSLVSKKPFEARYLTERQIELLADISNRFEIATGNEMEEFTHRKGMPWDKVWNEGQGKQKEIPYEYALDNLGVIEKEVVLHIAQERQAFLENYK